MASGNGTLHHRLHGLTGWVMIVTLPFVLFGLVAHGGGGLESIKTWLSHPLGAISTLFFMTAAMWYARLEMDEVYLDYFSGGLLKFALLVTKLLMFLAWAGAVFAIIKLWLGA